MTEIDNTGMRGALEAVVGPDGVRGFDEGDARAIARDIFFDGGECAFVVAPTDEGQVAAVVALAHRHGYAVFPRGGGMSYTRGYIPTTPRSILLDMGALNKIVTVDEANMFVTVQPGVTWKQLYETLAPRGLRLPAFGTISGAAATVGGGLSQGSIFYGSTRFGPTAEHVLGLKLVLADGTLLETGQAGTNNGKPFFRYYGPDLTGPFLGDCGALAIKVGMTFRMIRMPQHFEMLSFAFTDFPSLCETQCEIARRGLASDAFSFDGMMQSQIMQRSTLREEIAMLGKVLTGGGLINGPKSALKVVVGGKAFLKKAPYTLHMVIEADHAASARAMRKEAVGLALSMGGRPIPESVPKMMRASPFNSMDQVLGPKGERWVPVHGLIAFSDGPAAMAAVEAYLASRKTEIEAAGIETALLSNPVGASAMIIEILFYWPDAPHELHRKIVSPRKFEAASKFAENPVGRQLVGELRSGILDCFAQFGSATFGAGRSVPYARERKAETYALLAAIKQALDPDRTLNPGVLGLD